LAGVAVQFRGYRDGDLEAMFRLDEVCFEAPFRFSRGTMRRFAEAKRARVVLAEVAGELAGFCVVHVERGGVGYVVTLDVAPSWRRQGLAAMLMERVEVQAREAGCGAMVLHVFDGNQGAVRFYERSGYELVGRDVGFYGDGVDAMVYRKALGSVA
jgi:ribosomal-protein-alanine N-acetyltransferase